MRVRRTFSTTKICVSCEVEKPHSEFGRGNDSLGLRTYCRACEGIKQKARYQANPEVKRRNANRARSELRDEVLRAYGEKCACCGESQKMFLAIDHINNDGAEHRRNLAMVRKGGNSFYRWLKTNNWPSSFQILCQNCNWGKHVNGGICPHQSAVLG